MADKDTIKQQDSAQVNAGGATPAPPPGQGIPGAPDGKAEAGKEQVIGEGSAKLGSAPVGAQGVPQEMQNKQVQGGPTPAPAAPGQSAGPTGEREKTPIEKQDAKTAENKAGAAQAAGAEMFTVTVDGVPVEVPKGTLVIEACFRAGADVPYFCYHPRLTSVGACRMCLASVELEQFGARRTALMTTCNLQVQNGMVVKTGVPDVKKAQNGILEFLLANHPLDCPICDRGGECPLQNMTISYGPPTSRFIEEKRHYPKAQPLSDFVILDRERCIQCMRCTRFCDEIAGDGQLDLLNRGASSEIGIFFGTSFTSNFSGNTIEICPVGALTSRTYRFAGRPWEVKSVDSICAACGNGCNIAVQHRLGELVRINGRTNEEINEEWTCDRGKFGQYYVNDERRLSQPLIRREGELVEVSWDEALIVLQDRIRTYKEHYGPDSIAGIASTRVTLEENYLFARYMRALVGTNNIDHQMRPYPFEPMQTSIAAIENFPTIVSVGMKLDFEQPIVYLRVVKAVKRKNANWIQATSLDASVTQALTEAGENAVLLLPHYLDPEDILRAKMICRTVGAKLNVLLPDCNSWGAPLAGASPAYLPGMIRNGASTTVGFAEARVHLERVWNASLPTNPGLDMAGILAGAARGKIKMLHIMGSDPAKEYVDPELARKALANAAFVVVQDMFLTETARHADVLLPSSSFIEKDGTFVNIEGREQKIRQAILPRGNSRPDWRILADLFGRLGTPVPYFSARDIYREYARALPKVAVPAAV
ncbi:MAG: NADH-quinone oxidoreductase subunit NuoG [Capsulimonadales bacterium]|nr:NADH-quinone oxidoreductase subunit NuoG [Capsulimonadales bacterium]